MDAYALHDARYICQKNANSAANDLSFYLPGPPAGKVWTILSAAYYPSATETKIIHWAIYSEESTMAYPVTRPQSVACAAAYPWPMVTEGLEIKLYPKERLGARRDSATAGSTMSVWMRYVETDLPFYSYEEPQRKIVKSIQRRGSAYAFGETSSAQEGASSAPAPIGTPERGGRGGTQPV